SAGASRASGRESTPSRADDLVGLPPPCLDRRDCASIDDDAAPVAALRAIADECLTLDRNRRSGDAWVRTGTAMETAPERCRGGQRRPGGAGCRSSWMTS